MRSVNLGTETTVPLDEGTHVLLLYDIISERGEESSPNAIIAPRALMLKLCNEGSCGFCGDGICNATIHEMCGTCSIDCMCGKKTDRERQK